MKRPDPRDCVLCGGECWNTVCSTCLVQQVSQRHTLGSLRSIEEAVYARRLDLKYAEQREAAK